MFVAERNDYRPGQGSEIDDRLGRIGLLRPVERIAQYQPALGIGVEHLDRLSRHRRDDIAGALRIAVGHVFDEPADPDDVRLGLARSERAHCARYRRGTAHVPFHVFHARSGLEADAAGIEGDALADETDRPGAVVARAVPSHDEQAGRSHRTLRHAEQRAHAERFHLGFVEHVDFDAEIGHRSAPLDEAFRIDDVGGFGNQLAGERDAFVDAFVIGPFGGRFAIAGDDDDVGERRLVALLHPRAIGVDAPGTLAHAR